LITIAGPNLSNIPTPEIGKGLDGVAMVGSGPLVLVGTKARPMPPTLHDLLAQERAHPNAFSFASSGTGTIQHLAGALLNEQAGTRFTHIPYKGGAPAVVDVIGGQVALGILGAAPLLPHIKAGRLLVYGATSASRSPVLPDVPTLSELGLTGFSADQWYVVGTPAGTPAKRIQEVNAAISKALQSAELKSLLANAGVEPGSAWAPARVTEFVSTDLERWRALAKRAHIDLG
jgi:tripartite-type tricarboxylate transporter receptor subunit TctC